jgi:branched-chain amino acid transport system ATP-binding protein
MGVLTPRTGTVMLDGINIAGRKSHAIARVGMQLVHEERRVFGSLNVEENLVLAGLTAPRRWPLDRIYEVFPWLKEAWQPRYRSIGRRAADAGNRTRAERDPKIVLLDEPFEGLAPHQQRAYRARGPGAGNQGTT